MIGRTNAGGGTLGKSTLIVQTESGAVVTASKGSETKSAKETYGVWAFPGLSAGTWSVKAVKDGLTTTKDVVMDGTASLTLILYFNQIPTFTYTGEYEIVDDTDKPITISPENWNIRFLTSGTLRILDPLGAANGIDAFLVGGGGSADSSGSGTHSRAYGGDTLTILSAFLTQDTDIGVTIGSGGPSYGKPGGATVFLGKTAAGGKREGVAPYFQGVKAFGNELSGVYYGGNMEARGEPPKNTGTGTDNGRGSYPPLGSAGCVIIRNHR